MFERFTSEARTAVGLARQEARALGDQFIGTQHLLIGLAGRGADPAARALTAAGVTAEAIRDRRRESGADNLDPVALATLGIDLDQVRRATEERFGTGALAPGPRSRSQKGHVRFDDGAKKSLELAVRVAVSMRSDCISSGHLLLGIIDEGHSLGARVLTSLGADLSQLTADIVSMLGAEAA